MGADTNVDSYFAIFLYLSPLASDDSWRSGMAGTDQVNRIAHLNETASTRRRFASHNRELTPRALIAIEPASLSTRNPSDIPIRDDRKPGDVQWSCRGAA